MVCDLPYAGAHVVVAQTPGERCVLAGDVRDRQRARRGSDRWPVRPVRRDGGVSGRAAASELDTFGRAQHPGPPTRSKVLMANGKLLATLRQNRLPVPLSKIAPVMRQAQLAIGPRFYEHGALDFKARCVLWSATPQRRRPGGPRSRSVVKMVQVVECQKKGDTSASKTRGADHGAQDPRAAYAIAMEKKFTKDRSLCVTSTSPTTGRARTGCSGTLYYSRQAEK